MISSRNHTAEVRMHSDGFRYNASQRGSTLIAVLLILLVITVLGVMAMRQGLTTLNISTNAQVRQLLVQSSDAVLNQFSREDLTTITSFSGVLGAALGNVTRGQEYVFCYRPSTTQGFGRTVNANVIQSDGSGNVSIIDAGASGTGASGGGFCDLTMDFGSGRRAAITQVAVTIPTDAIVGLPGSNLSQGTNVSLGQSVPQSATTTQRIRVTSVAMLPAFTTTLLTTVQDTCIGKTDGTAAGRISDNADPSLAGVETLTDCLARYGVPANTQVQEFNLRTTLTPVP